MLKKLLLMTGALCLGLWTDADLGYGAVYGDVTGNGVVDLDDLQCVQTGMANPSACPRADLSPCGGDGNIDLDDLLAVIDAYGGGNLCQGQGGVASASAPSFSSSYTIEPIWGNAYGHGLVALMGLLTDDGRIIFPDCPGSSCSYGDPFQFPGYVTTIYNRTTQAFTPIPQAPVNGVPRRMSDNGRFMIGQYGVEPDHEGEQLFFLNVNEPLYTEVFEAVDVNDSGVLLRGASIFNRSSGQSSSIAPLSTQCPTIKAVALNNANQVAGDGQVQVMIFRRGRSPKLGCSTTESWRPFIWDQANGTRALTLPAGYHSGRVLDMDDHGNILGTAAIHNNGWIIQTDLVFWKKDGTSTVISFPSEYKFSASDGYDMNNQGQVVGEMGRGIIKRAFIYDAVNGVRELKALVPGFIGQLLVATEINDQGIILAIGKNEKGEEMNYYLTPQVE